MEEGVDEWQRGDNNGRGYINGKRGDISGRGAYLWKRCILRNGREGYQWKREQIRGMGGAR